MEKLRPYYGKFTAHSHDEYIISVNSAEVIREWVRLDGRGFSVGTAEITVYNPGQVQASVAETMNNADWECFSIHASTTVVSYLTGIDGFEAENPVVVDAQLAGSLRAAYLQKDPEVASSHTSWILSEVLGRNSPKENGRYQQDRLPGHEDLGPLIEQMREELSTPVRVAALAESLSISPQQFIRAFVHTLGVPPYAWHLQLRLREGRRRLQTGEPPSDVATALGFSDQAHFHRHFVRAYAQTPRAPAICAPEVSPRNFVQD